MNKKELIIFCPINDEERKVILSPEYPGSSIYNIYIDSVNQGQVRKITADWVVIPNENSMLKEQNHYSILNAVSNAEYLNN